MKTFVIGDIHGRIEALKEVLKKCGFKYKKDKLIVLGDIVDGGYNTYQVVEHLLKIQKCIYIIGNHDEWFMNHCKTGWAEEIWLSQGGANTIKSYGGVVIKEIDPTCRFKNKVEVGDTIVTVGEKFVLSWQDIQEGSERTRSFCIIKKRGGETDISAANPAAPVDTVFKKSLLVFISGYSINSTYV